MYSVSMRKLTCEMEVIFEEPEAIRHWFRQPCIFREPSCGAFEAAEQPCAHDVSRPTADEETFLPAVGNNILQLMRNGVQVRGIPEVLGCVFPQSSSLVFAERHRPVLDLDHESEEHGTDIGVARSLAEKVFPVIDNWLHAVCRAHSLLDARSLLIELGPQPAVFFLVLESN